MFQFDRSLVTVDIPGAQSKPRHNYMNRLLPNQMQYDDINRLQSEVKILTYIKLIACDRPEYKYGRRRYQHDFHHFNEKIVPQGNRDFPSSQKKHYQVDEGEIYKYRALENKFDLPKIQLNQDRILSTNDIDGAIPGTLISKVVRNKDVAQKLKIERENRYRQNYERNFSEVKDYNQEPIYNQRQKSYSVNQSPVDRLPQVQQFNPISNRMQEKPSSRNIMYDDYVRTLQLLNQKPTPLRLHV
ncbi:hypothetical protein pb186bvf_019387 [Paramecium bursaria]